MKKLQLLDAYCGAGGASVGYSMAGFNVTGVDIEPQKNYPFTFIQADAIEYIEKYGHLYDLIHTSPPCLVHSVMTKGVWKHVIDRHVNAIPATREALISTGKAYVIENVPGAKKELVNPLMLCGTMFGLQTSNGQKLKRHRFFESNPDIWFPPAPCKHNKEAITIGVYGRTGGHSTRDSLDGSTQKEREEAMGIDWMTARELVQAIPPAYTKFIGDILRKLL